MGFRLAPRWMTLDDLELRKFEFTENFAGFRRFRTEQQLNKMKIDQYCQRQRCTFKHVEFEQFLACLCFRVARVCQRHVGFLVWLRCTQFRAGARVIVKPWYQRLILRVFTSFNFRSNFLGKYQVNTYYGKYPCIYRVFTWVFTWVLTSFASQFGIYLGKYPGKYPECIYFKVLPTCKSAKFHEILRKFEPKWVITLLVKR